MMAAELGSGTDHHPRTGEHREMTFTQTARRLGIASATATAILIVAYAITLAVGFASLTSPDEPIRDPMVSILELLIIAMMPVMVTMMVAVHAWAPARAKALSFASVIFMGALCVLTCSIHSMVLTMSHHPAFAGEPWLPLVIEFRWPSAAYVLDVLGWDFFFPLSMLFGAMVFSGSRLATWIRVAMVVSGVLAFAGLIGAFTGNMQVRNIGVVGYVGVFLVVAVLLAIFFYRERPEEA
jgi:hypothetical protein